MNYRINILTVIILLAFSCQKKNESNIKTINKVIPNNDFLSIDSIDFTKHKKLFDLRSWVKDTITASNWQIQYFVKNDSTIDKDIYIKVSKDNFENIYKGIELLDFKRYFIPEYLTETKNKVLMKHACATECSAITMISKTKSKKINQLFNVVDFNRKLKKIVYITDSSYSHDSKLFQLGIYDLITEKTEYVNMQKPCSSIIKTSCIDTIIYKNDKVEIISVFDKK